MVRHMAMSSVARFCTLMFFFALLAESSRAEMLTKRVSSPVSNTTNTTTEVVVVDRKSNSGGSGNYGWAWGWGAGGGGGGGGGAGGGGGGGGGGWFGWGRCRTNRKRSDKIHKKNVFSKHNYVMGVFAECMADTRCYGMRLDCPLHCGGPCLYDCVNMCKAHCRRSRGGRNQHRH